MKVFKCQSIQSRYYAVRSASTLAESATINGGASKYFVQSGIQTTAIRWHQRQFAVHVVACRKIHEHLPTFINAKLSFAIQLIRFSDRCVHFYKHDYSHIQASARTCRFSLRCSFSCARRRNRNWCGISLRDAQSSFAIVNERRNIPHCHCQRSVSAMRAQAEVPVVANGDACTVRCAARYILWDEGSVQRRCSAGKARAMAAAHDARFRLHISC